RGAYGLCRPFGTRRLQRLADADRQYVYDAAIFSTGQPGHGDAALSEFRCESRWDGCMLWTFYRLYLLYFEYASGLAEVYAEPLVYDGGWGARGIGVCAVCGDDASRGARRGHAGWGARDGCAGWGCFDFGGGGDKLSV